MLKKIANLLNPTHDLKVSTHVVRSSIDAMRASMEEGEANQLYVMDNEAREKDARRLRVIAKWQMMGSWVLAILSTMSYQDNPTGLYIATILVVAGTLSGLINLWRSDRIQYGAPKSCGN